MEDITILHLSDLHINSHYSNTWEFFFKDLEQEIKNITDRRIVIVVTGDLIHQGVYYNDDPKVHENILTFFKNLKKVVENKCAGIYIVPGNHDKARTKEEEFLVHKYRIFDSKYKPNKSQFNNAFYDSFWKTHLESYGKTKGTGYLELTKEIYSYFGINDKSFISDTFGVDVLEINGKSFCFILFNTAWSCIDDFDDSNLICGQFQLDSIRKKYKELFSRGKKPNVTIALGHHPIDSFYGKERDYVFKEMISIDGFNANLYLCGHMHDDVVKNWANNRHSLNSFITGFGWPDNGGDHVAKHTYAMYSINQDANSVDVYMRQSSNEGEYIDNFSVYTKDTLETPEKHKLSFPLLTHRTITYIDINRGINRSKESRFLSKELLLSMREYNKITTRFSYLMCKNFEYINDDIYEELGLKDCIECTKTECDECYNCDVSEDLYQYLYLVFDEEPVRSQKVQKLFDENKEFLYQKFWEYLGSICQNLVDSIYDYVGEDTGIIRTHFRFFNKDTEEYKEMIFSVSKSINHTDYQVSTMKYGELIEAAHKCKTGLVFSSNREKVTKELNEKWSNFITIVPNFTKNECSYNDHLPNKKRARINRPYITFGVTVKGDKFNNLLYLMDYFSLKDSIDVFIDNFLDKFPIDMENYCRWINEQKEGEKI